MASKNELKKIYAARLKESLKYLQISQRNAAEKIGVPLRTFESWARGLVIPRADQLAALAKIGINPNYILLGEGPPILDICKKKSPEEEEFLRRNHEAFVTILEMGPASYKLLLKIYASEIKSKKVRKILRTAVLGPFFLMSEAVLGGLIEPFWATATRILESAYYAARLQKILSPRTVCALISMSNIPLEEWKKILEDLIPWTEDDLSRFVPKKQWKEFSFIKRDRKADPVADFLWMAVRQFYELLERKELPAFCHVHRKVFWSECPVCAEELSDSRPQEVVEESLKITPEKEKEMYEKEQAELTESYLEVGGSPETLHRIIDDVAAQHKAFSKNSR